MKKPVVILSLCLALLLFGVGAVAESAERETYISGGYTYALLEDGDAEILLYGAYEVDPVFREVEDLLIPSVLDGHPVTRIADRAFYPCRSLVSVTIPDSIREVGFNPFIGCIDLTTITLSPDHPYLELRDGVLFSKPDQRLVSYPTGWTETSYVIPEGTRIIGDYAFGNCKTLTDIDIPESVVSIGNGAFASCESLSSVSIPDGITRIGDDTFSLCVRMTDIAMPDSITYIGSFAFYNCISLSAVTIPENVTYIGEYAFVDCSLKTVTIPDSVISIGKDAFHRLPEAYVMDMLIKLNGSASVFLPSLVVGHGSYAEQYCIDNHLKYTFADGST